MSNGSPSAYLLWAILSCIFLAFLMLHLWAYDRFNCLRWGAGRQPGAFKRVMTYSYLGTVPLLVIFSVAITAIKFSEGYFVLPSGKIIPMPLILWRPNNRSWLLPLYFMLSIAWSLELVTHLEELTFWLFLLHQGPGKREWFYSWEFRTWYIGSIIAVLGMPLTTLITRKTLETCQAYIFLVGSSAGTTTTLCFLYVLFRFPTFIKHVKTGGAEPDVVVRLSTFYQLNRIRVMFRFLFTVPLLIIAVDGIHLPFSIVTNPFALDFLLMVGGIGCFVSSAITLLIFFPRSFAHEAGYKAKIHTPQTSRKVASTASPTHYYCEGSVHAPKQSLGLDNPVAPPDPRYSFQFSEHTQPETTFNSSRVSVSRFTESRHSLDSRGSPSYETDAESEAITSHTMPTTPPRTGEHRLGALSGIERSWERRDVPELTSHQLSRTQALFSGRGIHATTSLPARPRPVPGGVRSSLQLHPYVLNFTSPIDLADLPNSDSRAGYPGL